MKANLEVNPEIIQRNQLNTSKSKMQYSFAMSNRFSEERNKYNHLLSQIPITSQVLWLTRFMEDKRN